MEISFDTSPEQYRHWRLAVEGDKATLALGVSEDATIREGYRLKLNSYDLGVDIELYDALQRIRFEHPEVKTVVITSDADRMFCSGANIYMLGQSSHAWKVNFCKFTNETRNGIEDSSAYSGIKFIAAVNGACAGGGYELALACDEIILVDDHSSAVSLPEAPLLGVLPGTGGLTRLVDKRKVRRDLADVFCTNQDGVKGQRAKDWGLVDYIAAPRDLESVVDARVKELSKDSCRPDYAEGVKLTPLKRVRDGDHYHYDYVSLEIDEDRRKATLTVRAPKSPIADTLENILAAGANWWPLQMVRELDDAILRLRTNHMLIGAVELRMSGDAELVLGADKVLLALKDHWFVKEVINYMRRTIARIDVTSRSFIAIIDEESNFAGSLFELALAADRIYMLSADNEGAVHLSLSEMNFGPLFCINGLSRVETRFYGDPKKISILKKLINEPIITSQADQLKLTTFSPDSIDWDDEVRLAFEERAGMSPDALTGMEANLRFPGPETLQTKIFARLSAWQNWIFTRPNAVGESGALKSYGSGARPQFDLERV